MRSHSWTGFRSNTPSPDSCQVTEVDRQIRSLQNGSRSKLQENGAGGLGNQGTPLVGTVPRLSFFFPPNTLDDVGYRSPRSTIAHRQASLSDMSSDPDFSLIRFQNDAANSYLIAWTAILFWDWLILVRLETVYIWKAKTTPLKIAFLLQRYGTLIFMTIAAVLLLSPIPYGELKLLGRTGVHSLQTDPAALSTVRCQKIFWLETLGLNFALV